MSAYRSRFDRRTFPLISAVCVASVFNAATCPTLDGQAAENSAPAGRVWVLDALVKALPDAAPAPDAPGAMELAGPRAGMTAGQAVFRSESPVEKLSIELDPIKDEAGNEIRAKANFVGYVPISGRTAWNGVLETPMEELIVGDAIDKVLLVPDPLLPERVLTNLAPGTAQAVWVRLYPGREARPGVYSGALTLDADGARTSVPIAFTLSSATVPAERNYKYFNWFFQFGFGRRSPFEFPMGDPKWSAENWALMRDFIRHKVAHRKSVFDFQFWDVVKIVERDGKISVDFTWMDMFIDMVLEEDPTACFEAGNFGMFHYAVPDPIPEKWDPWKKEDQAKGTELALAKAVPIYSEYSYDGTNVIAQESRRIRIPIAIMDESVKAILEALLPALDEYVRNKGLEGRFYCSIKDEPAARIARSYRQVALFVKERAPSVRITDAIRHSEADMVGAIDAWRPLVTHFEKKPDFYRERVKAGDELFSYYCGADAGCLVNRFLITPLLKTRVSDWINFKYGITGFLHWAYTYDYPSLPVEKPFGAGWGGDSFIVYRGADDRPLDSIRYEAALNGIEDYELLLALSKRNRAAAQALADFVVETGARYTRHIGEFRAAHATLLELCAMSDAELAEKGMETVRALQRFEPLRPAAAE